MASKLILFALLAVVLVGSSSGHSLDGLAPAIRGVLTQSGANYLINSILPVIISRLAGLKIPDVDGTFSAPLIGNIDYNIKNVALSNVVYQSASVNVQTGLTATLNGVGAHIHFDWGFRQRNWPHISSSGNADVDITGSSISMLLTTGVTVDGEPQLYAQNVDVNFQNMDIHVHGSSLSWLYDLIAALAKSTIKKEAANAVATNMKQLINVMANAALATIPLEVPVSAVAKIDMRMTQAPTFANSLMSVFLLGQFENITNPVPCPLPHVTLPSNPPTRMVQADVDQFVFNSGFWYLFQNKMLSHLVTQADIPPAVGLKLNTNTFGALVPPLKTLYPNTPLEWQLDPLSQPSAAITPDQGVVMSASFSMTWLVGNDTFVPAFTLALDIQARVQLATVATNITGNVTLTALKISTISSNVGQFDTKLLNTFFNAIVGGPIINMVNTALKAGLPLPVFAGIGLANPVLSNGAGFFSLSTDVTYVPPASVLRALDEVVALRQATKVGIIHLGRTMDGRGAVGIN